MDSVAVGNGDVHELMFFEHAEVVGGGEGFGFIGAEEGEVYLVEVLFGVVEFTLCNDFLLDPLNQVILSLLIPIRSSLFPHPLSNPCHLLKLNPHPNPLQLRTQLIVLLEILIFHKLMFILHRIFGIVQSRDMEDKLFIDMGTELVWFVWLMKWVHY